MTDFRKWIEKYSKPYGFKEDWTFYDMEQAFNAGASSRWIPVEERLPDKEIAGSQIMACRYENGRWKYMKFDYFDMYDYKLLEDRYFTHWREIEPPQDEV